jgi:hypothetical protein
MDSEPGWSIFIRWFLAGLGAALAFAIVGTLTALLWRGINRSELQHNQPNSGIGQASDPAAWPIALPPPSKSQADATAPEPPAGRLHHVHVDGRPEAECLAETANVINEDYIRCRHGFETMSE